MHGLYACGIVKRKSLLHVCSRGEQLADNSQVSPKFVVGLQQERWILGALCDRQELLSDFPSTLVIPANIVEPCQSP